MFYETRGDLETPLSRICLTCRQSTTNLVISCHFFVSFAERKCLECSRLPLIAFPALTLHAGESPFHNKVQLQ